MTLVREDQLTNEFQVENLVDFIHNSLTFDHLKDLGFKTINLIQLKFTTEVYTTTGNIRLV